jgi:hypothetical protein
MKHVISTGDPSASVAFDARLLLKLLQLAKQYADEGKRITIELRVNPRSKDAGLPVVVRAMNVEGQRFTGLLVRWSSRGR